MAHQGKGQHNETHDQHLSSDRQSSVAHTGEDAQVYYTHYEQLAADELSLFSDDDTHGNQNVQTKLEFGIDTYSNDHAAHTRTCHYDVAPSLIDYEVDMIDEILFQDEIELTHNKPVILDDKFNEIPSISKHSTPVANVKKSEKLFEAKYINSKENKEVEQKEKETRVDSINIKTQRGSPKVSTQTKSSIVKFSTKDELQNHSENKQEREALQIESTQKIDQKNDNSKKLEEKEKVKQICSDIGLNAQEFFNSQQQLSQMILKQNLTSKSQLNLINVESEETGMDILHIQETFFEDPDSSALREYGEIVGMEEKAPETEEETLLGNIKTPTQRWSEATALKFIIDLSESLEIHPPKEKKEKKTKSKGIYYHTAGRQSVFKPSQSTPTAADNMSGPSNLSKSSKVSNVFKRTGNNKGDSTFEQEPDEKVSMMPIRRTSLCPSELTYDFDSRLTNIEEAMQSWYDFNKISEDGEKEIVLIQTIPEEKTETSSSEEVEEEERLDRGPYFKRYYNAVEQQKQLRIKNNILQKFIVMHLRRRKVQNFLMEIEPPLEQGNKYNQKLSAYGEIRRVDEERRALVEHEINLFKQIREKKFLKCVRIFDDFQQHEESIGTGLINTKTGKPIPERLFERYMRRQRATMNILCRMRLDFIKIRNMLDEKNQTLDDIDRVTPTKRLIEYEQLKCENRGLADRIEEKDEELVRVRSKCEDTIQVLAHIREKISALTADNAELRVELQQINLRVRSNREAVNTLRKERTIVRAKLNKLKEDSGLLTEPDLLADMEDNKAELEHLTQGINELKEDVASRTKEIKTIKINIQNQKLHDAKRQNFICRSSLSVGKTLSYEVSEKSSLKHKLFNKSKVSLYSRASRKSKLYIDDHKALFKQTDKVAFDDLVRIKPTSRMSMRKRSSFFTSNF